MPGGFASIRSVLSMEHEDHMHSFFLAESCKYLYLMANDSFMQVGGWTTLFVRPPATVGSCKGPATHYSTSGVSHILPGS